MNNKVLVSPSSFGQISKEPIELLEENGFEYVPNPYHRKLTADEVIELASDCVGIVAGVEPLNQKVIDACKNLKCISRVGVGMDSVDIEYAEKKGISVVNTPFGPTRAVAELTLGLTMSLLRKIPMAHRNLKSGTWKKETGNLLLEKKIGVVGLGKIGRLSAELFRSLNNPVIGYDPYADETWAKVNQVELVDFDSLLIQADIITLHIPPKADRSPVISKREMGLLKSNVLIINVSRGGVVDEHALFEALNNGNIAGAAIDVFNEEPYHGPFLELENVILTPHLGSYAAEGKLQMEIDAVKNLIKILH
jgi:D-3-phosphoglycerate dehydrogenase